MDKTPKVNRVSKASPVRVIKADGTVEMQAAYDILQLRQIKGHGPTPPSKLKPKAKPNKKTRRRYISVRNAAKKKPGSGY